MRKHAPVPRSGVKSEWRLHEKSLLQMQQALNGAAYEARTRYLHLGKVALYRMS